MSRSGYSEDCWGLELGQWRAQVASAIRGKRGQAFLRELVEALDALPEKKLIAEDLVRDGEYCALGALGVKRKIDMSNLDPLDRYTLSDVFGVAHQLIAEVEWMNDEGHLGSTPENRWKEMRAWAVARIKKETP